VFWSIDCGSLAPVRVEGHSLLLILTGVLCGSRRAIDFLLVCYLSNTNNNFKLLLVHSHATLRCPDMLLARMVLLFLRSRPYTGPFVTTTACTA
jgi:hypothetical protein